MALYQCIRSFANGGVQRGFTPLPRDWECPPVSKFPQEWGTQGVERRLLNNLMHRFTERPFYGKIESVKTESPGCQVI
jgi:hypothetical protein